MHSGKQAKSQKWNQFIALTTQNTPAVLMEAQDSPTKHDIRNPSVRTGYRHWRHRTHFVL